MPIYEWPISVNCAHAEIFLSEHDFIDDKDIWIETPDHLLEECISILRSESEGDERLANRFASNWLVASISLGDWSRSIWVKRYFEALAATYSLEQNRIERFQEYVGEKILALATECGVPIGQIQANAGAVIEFVETHLVPQGDRALPGLLALTATRYQTWWNDEYLAMSVFVATKEAAAFARCGFEKDAIEVLLWLKQNYSYLEAELRKSDGPNLDVVLSHAATGMIETDWSAGGRLLIEILESCGAMSQEGVQGALYQKSQLLEAEGHLEDSYDVLRQLLALGDKLMSSELRMLVCSQFAMKSIDLKADLHAARKEALRSAQGLPNDFTDTLKTMFGILDETLSGKGLSKESLQSFENLIDYGETINSEDDDNHSPSESATRLKLGLKFERIKRLLSDATDDIETLLSGSSQLPPLEQQQVVAKTLSFYEMLENAILEHKLRLHNSQATRSDFQEITLSESTLDFLAFQLMRLMIQAMSNKSLTGGDAQELVRQLQQIITEFTDRMRAPFGLGPMGTFIQNEHGLRSVGHMVFTIILASDSDAELSEFSIQFTPSDGDFYSAAVEVVKFLESCSGWLTKGLFPEIHDNKNFDSLVENEHLSQLLDSRAEGTFNLKLQQRRGNVWDTFVDKKMRYAIRAAEAVPNVNLPNATPLINAALNGSSDPLTYIVETNETDDASFILIIVSKGRIAFLRSKILDRAFITAVTASEDFNQEGLEIDHVKNFDTIAEEIRRLIRTSQRGQENSFEILSRLAVRDLSRHGCSLMVPAAQEAYCFVGAGSRNTLPSNSSISNVGNISFWTPANLEEPDDALAGVHDELNAIQNLVSRRSGQIETLVGSGCRRSAFIKKDWHDQSIIHISSHGHFFNNLPEAGHLQFWKGSDTEPSSLHSFDILALDLRQVPLVVLNCCVTGRSSRVFGSDRMSIAYAFVAAGAERVIATRWPIRDLYAIAFARNFYSCLAEGSSGDIDNAFFESLRMMREQFGDEGVLGWAAYELLR